jgi:hypothetical protein
MFEGGGRKYSTENKKLKNRKRNTARTAVHLRGVDEVVFGGSRKKTAKR